MSRRVDDESRLRPLTAVLVTQPEHKFSPERCRMKHSLASSSKEGRKKEAARDFPSEPDSIAHSIQSSQCIVTKLEDRVNECFQV